MDNLEPRPKFYAKYRYGEYEKKLIHYATVSMLNNFF